MSAMAAATVRLDVVERVTPLPAAKVPSPSRLLDPESREWLRSLRADGATRDEAVARLHLLLLGAARFEVARRRRGLPHIRGDELDDIALEAADDAMVSVLARLDSFRGASRFTTWVYKFALLEAAVKLRKRAWQGREVPLEPATWNLFSSLGLEPDAVLEQRHVQRARARVLGSSRLAQHPSPHGERRAGSPQPGGASSAPLRAREPSAPRLVSLAPIDPASSSASGCGSRAPPASRLGRPAGCQSQNRSPVPLCPACLRGRVLRGPRRRLRHGASR